MPQALRPGILRTEVHVRAIDAVHLPGAHLEVLLVDGVNQAFRYDLLDTDPTSPPSEIHLDRPVNVPALLTTRDPAFVYFARSCEYLEGAPVYHLITHEE